MDKSNLKDISIPAGTVLRNSDLDLDQYVLLEVDKAGLYRQIVRSTIYLSNCTRPDIAYAVRQLARHTAKPNKYHLRIGKLLLRYLKGTVSLGIVYRPTSSGLDYTIWTDAT